MAPEDLRDHPTGSRFLADLCIVGSGPAGITIARQLAATGARICVLESGGEAPDTEVEDLNEIENVGMRRAPQAETRARGLGGTSALWSGRCGALDDIDYAHRPWVPHSGWPISADDVAPYLDRAGVVLGLGPARYRGAAVDRVDPPAAGGWDPRLLLPLVFQASIGDTSDTEAVRSFVEEGVEGAELIGALQHAGTPRPMHFGEVHVPHLEASPNVRILTYATAVEIETDEGGRTVTGVAVCTPDGRRSQVVAPRVVVACGGIENARLLLASRSVNPRGVGNDHDLVGRYLMDHPLAPFAGYEGGGPAGLRRRLGQRWVDVDGVRHVYSMAVRLSPALQRAEGLLNAQIHTLDFGDLRSPLRRAHDAVSAVRDRGLDRSTAAELAAAARHPHRLARSAYERQVLHRPSLVDADQVVLACVVEQVPDPASRVTLADRLDRVGMPVARVDWRASDDEVATLSRMVEIFGAEVRRLGYPAPEPAPWLAHGATGWRDTVHDMAHPTGTTRMASDPRAGVVDADCQVHGVAGLFVAGSSVFATSGYVNPTLTIVALALRLADFLEKDMSSTAPVPVTVARPDPPTRVGIVGLGNRVRGHHLRVLQALPDRFEVVGFSSRTDERRSRIATDTGLAGYASPEELVTAARPDLVLIAVVPDAVDTAVPPMLDLGVPLLIETPISWNIGIGRALVKRIEDDNLTVAIAEQTPFLPLEQLKRAVIEQGLLGHVLAAHNDFAVFDYHGLAALRAYLGAGRTPVRANATSVPFGGGALQLGTVTYDDGATLIQHFGAEYGDPAFGRPQGIRALGTAGSFVNDSLVSPGADGSAVTTTVERVEVEGRLQELVLDAPGATVRWRNPFADQSFDDEQIAVASVLVATADAVRTGGDVPYRAADSLLDMEILAAMRYSSQGDGRPVRLPVNVLDKVRSVDPVVAVRTATEKLRNVLNR